MRSERLQRFLFLLAALYNFVWTALFFVSPELVMREEPAFLDFLTIGVFLVGVAFAIYAYKPYFWLLVFVSAAKALGPYVYIYFTSMGYLTWDDWWMPLVNDLIWLPILFAAWRTRGNT